MFGGSWAWSDAAVLVVAGGVEGEFAQEFTVVGDDADAQVVDQEQHWSFAVGLADADVVEPGFATASSCSPMFCCGCRRCSRDGLGPAVT
jgi:hypothetical protein